MTTYPGQFAFPNQTNNKSIMFLLKIFLSAQVLVLSSFFLFPNPTEANTNKPSRNYKSPPPQKIAQRRSVGSGARSLSCQTLFAKNSLTLLVPQEEVVHYTVSRSPSFYVYAQAESTVPLIFNLVIPDPTANNPVIERTLTIEQSGLHEIKLPTEIKLETDVVYFWQIGIPCSNNPQEIDQVIKAAVKKVRVDAKLAHQLKLANSPLEEAQIYASSGIWYDSLSFALKQAQSSSKSVDYVQKLGQEIGIDLEVEYLSGNN